MSLVQTVLVFVGLPLAIYGLVALLTLRSRAASRPRYRPGQDWDYPAVWWTANPAGVGVDRHAGRPTAEATDDSATGEARTAVGGARGSW
ncbi:hypothetical protein [Herbihabitans rhizosphaerae]|uniref:aa3-type cytochrome oxidase subunit CtaJ n=1 Tax=Herbihabitans rhizosphaerae TaxID=1872711 RepID=UPI00102CA0D7|nr:hypothetical protein [Herbihabitans rhizosphaerae]